MINPYLTSEDRSNFNAILEPTERVSKRFPKDFAIKHSLKTFLAAQRSRSLTIHAAIRECELAIRIDKQVDKNTIRSIRRYVQFISSLQAKLIFQYKATTKESALNDLNFFLDENECVARFISPKLKERIKDAISIVYYTDFIRDAS